MKQIRLKDRIRTVQRCWDCPMVHVNRASSMKWFICMVGGHLPRDVPLMQIPIPEDCPLEELGTTFVGDKISQLLLDGECSYGCSGIRSRKTVQINEGVVIKVAREKDRTLLHLTRDYSVIAPVDTEKSVGDTIRYVPEGFNFGRLI